MLDGCNVVLPVVERCSVAGVLEAGGFCANSLGGTRDLSPAEMIDFLEPKPERENPDRPGEIIPARGPAICYSSEDDKRVKDALEKACRLLGSHCTKEAKEILEAMR